MEGVRTSLSVETASEWTGPGFWTVVDEVEQRRCTGKWDLGASWSLTPSLQQGGTNSVLISLLYLQTDYTTELWELSGRSTPVKCHPNRTHWEYKARAEAGSGPVSRKREWRENKEIKTGLGEKHRILSWWMTWSDVNCLSTNTPVGILYMLNGAGQNKKAMGSKEVCIDWK